MENMHNDIRVKKGYYHISSINNENVSLFCSFMKDFKRKGSLSLIEELKTHSKFPLIGTFMETLTGSSKEVQYHMIFVSCLYSQFGCVNTISFPEGCANAEKYGVVVLSWLFKCSVKYFDQTLLVSCETLARSKVLQH